MRALLRLTSAETTMFLREPLSVIFAVALPPVLLIVFGVIPSFNEPDPDLGGVRIIDLYLPIIIAMAIAMVALANLPQHLATYREKGVLRRMRTTPITPTVLLGAHLLMCVLVTAITSLAVLTLGALAFDVALPQNLLGYLLAFALTALATLSVGLLAASWAPGGTSASAIGLVSLFPLLFFAGLWVPRVSMSEVLRTISDLTPLGAGVQALDDAAAGGWPQLVHLAVLVAWTIVAGGLAARTFRWE
ncbi:ABC transporter permease [Ruania halotolerans]|uniref:ABC transporter permease n=1 Tax=Ruania halotolerans TaxID=2897773 RepID=UPI001E584A7C|nr:ABC transporter permease [Ruania halotolerans]UFU05706.1 ABC transporter permease [Ruania halotolerans]